MTCSARSARPWLVAAAVVAAVPALAGAASTTASARKPTSLPHCNEKRLPEPIRGARGASAIPAFLDRGPETAGSAEQLTKVHAVLAARGYRFDDLEP